MTRRVVAALRSIHADHEAHVTYHANVDIALGQRISIGKWFSLSPASCFIGTHLNISNAYPHELCSFALHLFISATCYCQQFFHGHHHIQATQSEHSSPIIRFRRPVDSPIPLISAPQWHTVIYHPILASTKPHSQRSRSGIRSSSSTSPARKSAGTVMARRR